MMAGWLAGCKDHSRKKPTKHARRRQGLSLLTLSKLFRSFDPNFHSYCTYSVSRYEYIERDATLSLSRSLALTYVPYVRATRTTLQTS